MWRFFGYYGGLNVVGNLSSYGQYADDSTFEIVPTWQNKLQAMAYEDALWTRISHYSYEIKNNKLRLFPQPDSTSPEKFWVQFSIENQYSPWEEGSGEPKQGIKGINNMNTLPFTNLPFENINAIGKQWIRRFALALTKEMLAEAEKAKSAAKSANIRDLEETNPAFTLDTVEELLEDCEKRRDILKNRRK